MRPVNTLVRPLVAALLLALALPSVAAAEPATYKVDPVHSFVVFRIRHLNVGNAYGRFNEPTGTVTYDSGNPEALAFDLTIQAEKVDTGHQGRDAHLRRADFFDAKQFPTITFKSTAAKKAADQEGEKYEVTGDLTLHGVTKPITVTVAKVGEGPGQRGAQLSGWETRFTIKRSDFGMNFMQGPLGDEVTLVVALEAAKQ